MRSKTCGTRGVQKPGRYCVSWDAPYRPRLENTPSCSSSAGETPGRRASRHVCLGGAENFEVSLVTGGRKDSASNTRAPREARSGGCASGKAKSTQRRRRTSCETLSIRAADGRDSFRCFVLRTRRMTHRRAMGALGPMRTLPPTGETSAGATIWRANAGSPSEASQAMRDVDPPCASPHTTTARSCARRVRTDNAEQSRPQN